MAPFVLAPSYRVWRSRGRVSFGLWLYCAALVTVVAAFGWFGVVNYWARKEALGAAAVALPMSVLAARHWMSSEAANPGDPGVVS